MKVSTLIYIEKILRENAGFDERMYNHLHDVVGRLQKQHDFDDEFTVKEQKELDEAKAERDRLFKKHCESRDALEDFLSHDFH